MGLEDEIVKFSVDIEMNKADQQAFSDTLKEVTQVCSDLRKEIKLDEQALAIMAAKGEKNSKVFAELSEKVRENRQRLKENRETADLMSKALDRNSMSAEQLRKYAQKLRKELDSTSKSLNPKEWNRLNREYAATRDRLNEVAAGTARTQASCRSLFGSVASFAKANPWALLVATLSKFAKDMVSHTQTMGDAWTHFTSGLKKSYQSVLTTVSTGDWSNLFRNLREAYSEGRRLSAVLDELFELNNSLSLMEVSTNAAVAEQQAIMRDTSKTSAQRIAAAREILRLENDLRRAKKETAEVELSAARDALRLQTKMTDGEMESFIDNYIGNRDTYRQAEQVLALEQRISSLRKERKKQSDTGTADVMISTLEQERQSLLDSNAALSDAIDTIRRYNIGNDDLVKSYVDARRRMLQADADYQQGTVRSRAFLSSESYRAEKEEAERASREQQNILKKQYSEGLLSKDEYDRRMLSATEDHLRRQIETAARYGQDTSELEGNMYDAAISRQEAFRKAVSDGNRELFKELMKDMDAGIRRMEAELDRDLQKLGDDITTDDEQDFLGKLRAADTINRESGSTRDKLSAAENDFDLEMSQLEELHDMQLVSEEAYQERKKEIIEKYIKECARIQSREWENGLQTAMTFINGVSNLASALQNAETASLDARMQAELTAAGDNADERARIEEEYEAKKLEIQKKYADIDMGIQIAQAVASAALAMVQAWNAAGGQPAVAAIIMALIGATTAIQIAAMVAQRNAIQNASAGSSSSATQNRVVTSGGFSEGGYTGDGGRLEPAGIVHRGEYVVPVPEMRNPAVLSRVRDIEAIRTQRTSAHRLPGYAEGGYTSGPSGAQDTNALLVQAINGLRANPLKAYVVLSEIQSQQELENRFKTAASRS